MILDTNQCPTNSPEQPFRNRGVMSAMRSAVRCDLGDSRFGATMTSTTNQHAGKIAQMDKKTNKNTLISPNKQKMICTWSNSSIFVSQYQLPGDVLFEAARLFPGIGQVHKVVICNWISCTVSSFSLALYRTIIVVICLCRMCWGLCCDT